jgi:NAD(P)-dependent dehydrogenase (short-subunit alcohol dehydrogenase family)
MNVWGARIAIVTAAYSGLGRHVAMQLAQQGYDLVLATGTPRARAHSPTNFGLNFPTAA